MAHWTDEFYRRIDASDPSSGDLWAEDIYVECASFPPTRGRAAAFVPGTGFTRIVSAIQGVAHDTLARWDVSPDEVIYRFRVNYTRLDGRVVQVPAVTTLRRNGVGLIDDLRLYIDPSPIFTGLSARIVGAGSVTVDLTGEAATAARDKLWDSLIGDPADVLRFSPDIGTCQVVELGGDAQAGGWLVRDIVIDGVNLRQRVTFEPPSRLTITPIDGEQSGDIHLFLDQQDEGLTLSVQFDLVWHGIAQSSFLVPLLAARLRDRYVDGLKKLIAEIDLP